MKRDAWIFFTYFALFTAPYHFGICDNDPFAVLFLVETEGYDVLFQFITRFVIRKGVSTENTSFMGNSVGPGGLKADVEVRFEFRVQKIN